MPAQRHTETLCAFHHANFCLLASSLLPWPGKCTESGGFWMSKSEETQVYPVLKSFICWNDVYMLQVFSCSAYDRTKLQLWCNTIHTHGRVINLDSSEYTGWLLAKCVASQSRSFFHSLNGWMRKCKIYRSSKPQLFIYLFFEFAIWRCCMVHHCADGAASK